MNRIKLLINIVLFAFIMLGQRAIAQNNSTQAGKSTIVVSTNFDGGIGDVISIDQTSRTISIKIPKGAGWKVKYYIKVTGITPGETIKLNVSGFSHWGKAQPCFSLNGENWDFAENADFKQDTKSIETSLLIKGSEAWISWYPPFTSDETDKLIALAEEKNKYAKSFELCKSNILKRSVMALRVSEPTATKGIWIQSLQHAQETGSAWRVSGFVKWLLSDDPLAEGLRRDAEITIVPIMDIDNVVRGFGGKDELPHDHNRDWIETIYAEVDAAQKELTHLYNSGRLDVFVDNHNQGWDNNYFGGEIVILGGDSLFQNIFNEEQTIFKPGYRKLIRDNKIGRDNDNASRKKIGNTASSWVKSNFNDVLAVTIESNVARPDSCKLAPPLYNEQAGADMGRAVARYLGVVLE